MIIVAVMMLIVLGAAGIAFDFGRFSLTKDRDQSAADAAAYSAALGYAATGSSSTAAMQACVTAAQNGVAVTCVNPIPASIITTAIGPSPTNAAQQAAHVKIYSTMKLSAFGGLLEPSGKNSLQVTADAWAMITPGANPCVIALSPAGGPVAINMAGSAAIDAPTCSVEAGGEIEVGGGNKVNALSVFSGNAIAIAAGGSVTANPQLSKYSFSPTPTQPADPYASSAVATTGFSRLTTVAGYSAASTNPLPAAPSGGSTPTPACGATVASGTYASLTLNGPASSNCTFTLTGPLNVSGTLTIGNNDGGASGNIKVILSNNSTYDINKIVNASAGDLIQTTGSTFNIYNGITTGANASDLSIGCSARFTATVSGQSYLGCSGSDPDTNTYHIRGGVSTEGASLAFGNGDFTISGGVLLDGGANCVAANTLQFGNSTSSFIVTDTGITLHGGCFIFGNATNHDINSGGPTGTGIVNPWGSATLTFGTGTYTINGAFTIEGASISTGSDITLVSSGDVNVKAAASINWSGPPGAPYLIATNSKDSPAVALSGGTNGTLFDGIVYAPNGNVDLEGSAAINADPPVTTPPFCFTLVAKTILLQGDTSVTADPCPGAGGAGAGNKVSLVQ